MQRINFQKFQVNEETREITFSCASDKPYERFDEQANIAYNQILIIDESAVDLSRLNNSAPVLFNHNTDKLLGMVQKAWIVEDRIYVRVRFSVNDQFADRIYKDILDGLIKNVSIGYVVQGYEDKKQNGTYNRYVTKWMIYETSIVSIPADDSVGFRNLQIKDNTQMEDNKEKQLVEQQAEKEVIEQAVESTEQPKQDQLQRLQKEIEDLKAENEKLQQKLLADEEVKEQVVEQVKQEQIVDECAKKEIEKIGEDFDIPQEQIRSAVEKKMSIKDFKTMIKNKSFNIKSKEDTKMNKKLFREYLQERNFDAPFMLRDFAGFSDSNLVATETLPLVAVLQKRMGLQGFRTLSGLNSQIEIPIQQARNTVTTPGINEASVDSNPTFAKLTLAPVKFVASTVIGKEMLTVANSDVQAFIIDSITHELAYEVEKYMLSKIAEGADAQINYSALNAFTWNDALAFEASIGGYNLNQANFVMSASARATLKGIEKANGTAQFICDNNEINGYKVAVSGCVADDNIYFGAMDNLVLASFGDGLSIVVDPFTQARSGAVVIVGSVCIDAGLTAPKAFAVGKVQA